jgi:alpha-L-fucosidase
MTLMGVAPRADGTFPDAQVKVLKGLGKWMEVNKPVLYGSKWQTYCENGSFRFVTKEGELLAIELEKPDVPEIIPGVRAEPGSVIRMQGSRKKLKWHQDGEDLVIEELPDPLPCDHAWIFRIREKNQE